jgi:hypothetical protein
MNEVDEGTELGIVPLSRAVRKVILAFSENLLNTVYL